MCWTRRSCRGAGGVVGSSSRRDVRLRARCTAGHGRAGSYLRLPLAHEAEEPREIAHGAPPPMRSLPRRLIPLLRVCARRVCVGRIRDSRVGRCVRRALEVADVDATVGARAQLRRAARRVAVDGEPAPHASAPGQQIRGQSRPTAPCPADVSSLAVWRAPLRRGERGEEAGPMRRRFTLLALLLAILVIVSSRASADETHASGASPAPSPPRPGLPKFHNSLDRSLRASPVPRARIGRRGRCVELTG